MTGVAARDTTRFELWSVTFVLSAGMLGYEILLTRVASVLLTSDHLFLVLALALLGLATGAIAEYFIAARPERLSGVTPGLLLSGNGAVAVTAILALATLGPSGGVMVLALAASLPFASGGLILARIFRLFPERAGTLYGADLLGAATGALLVPASLTAMGPVQSIVLYAVVQASTGAILVIRRGVGRRALVAVAATVFAGAVFALNQHDGLLGPIPVGRSLDKDLFRLSVSAPGGVETVDTRWSTFGRTDLVRFARDPDSMSIFIDGAAGTPMFRFDGDLTADSASLRNVNRGFAAAPLLALLSRDRRGSALVIGPGGGRDVLLALQAGFARITAVEINPQMIEIVRANAPFNGGIYTRFANVEIVTDEGRRYLRATEGRYDLITLFMPITKSSRGLNVFALSESYLFTREAFRDYHRHLSEKGTLLIMAHGMEEAVKLTATAVEALGAEGLSVREAMDHVCLLGSHMMPYFLMAKRPFDAEQSAELHELAHGSMFDSQYSYVPGVEQEWATPPASASARGDVPMMNPLLYAMAEGSLPLAELERGLGLNLVPATDDRPFFSQFGLGLPGPVLTMLWVSAAALMAAVFIPMRRMRANLAGPGPRNDLWVPLWFTGIGAGFIILELVLFQELVFHLGDPSRSLALLLASLLIGSGAGSLLSTRMRDRGAVAAGVVSAASAVVMASFLLPMVFPALRAASPGARLSVAGALLVVQGVSMGMMFPIGLRVAVGAFGPAAVPWMWAVNGAASVAGSALTIVVAMTAGYNWSLALGVGCYAVAALGAYLATRSRGVTPGALHRRRRFPMPRPGHATAPNVE